MTIMTNGVYALIPARGGSKGLSRKCLATVGGKPLLQRAVESAMKAEVVTKAFVSTDDIEFAEKAREWGADVPFIRPAELARDTSSTIDVISHFVAQLHQDELPEYLLLIQPTTPLLKADDIDQAFSLFNDRIDAVTSVCDTEVNPDWLRRLDDNGYLEMACRLDVPQHTPRQKMPITYRLNGAIYFCRTTVFMNERTLLPEKTVPYVMPQERSIDIDSEFDLQLANLITTLI